MTSLHTVLQVFFWFSEKYLIKCLNDAHFSKNVTFSCFHLQPAIVEDDGYYECYAENKFGQIDGTTQLIVRSKNKFILLTIIILYQIIRRVFVNIPVSLFGLE